ncbi:MAG: penicillin-binding protein 2 [Candidatus Hydrogenedentes bacterium]|nr:penicillin-binding protein 2 [Candidatus Hydrogenedentota bacterium]
MPAKKQCDDTPQVHTRLSMMAVAVVALSTVLCLRLWQLQIVNGADFAAKAENNRLDYEVLKSPRGIIYGRDEKTVLADNRAACDLVVTPALLKDVDAVQETWPAAASVAGGGSGERLLCIISDTIARGEPLDSICDIAANEADREKVAALLPSLGKVRSMCGDLGQLASVDADRQFVRVLNTVRWNRPFKQILIKEDISKTERMRIEEYAFKFQGVYTVARPQRRYYYGATAGQVLGWFNEINDVELEKLKPRYKMGDIIGRDGIEFAYEGQLKGTDGAMIVSRYSGSVPQIRTDARGNPYIEVDSKGRALAEEERHEAIPGRPIFTTLDIELQRKCEDILTHELFAEDIVDTPAEGAIVVMNADTGELLALASVPTFDPNIFATTSADNNRVKQEVKDDPKKPMLHRAFQTHYYPGSVFKVLMAIAALEEGVIDEHTSFFCGGSYTAGGATWRCWKHAGHGTVSVVDALAFSCDVFFYNVGAKLGPDKMDAWAAKLGVGVKTGIDLPREVPGQIFTPAEKAAYAKATGAKHPDLYKWHFGDTISMAIGQGMVDTTILQNALLMATVINGGKRVRPYVNLELGPQVSEQLVSDTTLRIVHDGMFKCVDKTQPPSGTGRLAKIEGIEMLGKTGTAQVVRMAQLKGRKERDIPYDLRDHALFIAGVTNMKPRIAVSIIVEHGLHGSSGAAPVAKKVCEFFYINRAQQEGGAAPTKPLTVAMQEVGGE